MKVRVCQLSEVFQHEFANLSLPCEGRFREPQKTRTDQNVLRAVHSYSMDCEQNYITDFIEILGDIFTEDFAQMLIMIRIF